jgi:peptidyl-prolyl cis-trans isomerase C
MNAWMRQATIFLAVTWANALYGQTPPSNPTNNSAAAVQVPPSPSPTLVAATVDGQEILELQVYRGLLRDNPKNWPAARKEVLTYLIDNAVVDQYLARLNIEVTAKEVDERLAQVREESKKNKEDFQEVLNKLQISEAELRKVIFASLRWDKFVLQQGTDKVLLDYFQKNPAMFDGSQVEARHILISAKDDAEGAARIGAIKKGIEDAVSVEVAKLSAGTDKLIVEKQRTQALLVAFAKAAEKDSTCPSSKKGGELGWFPRVGAMVEPFARTAFALQPNQLSDAVKTEFGYHLILTVDKKPGREVKFDDVKPFVAEIYGERLREAILAAYKPKAKIVVNDAK